MVHERYRNPMRFGVRHSSVALLLTMIAAPAQAQTEPVPNVTGRVPQPLPDEGAINLPPPPIVNDPDLAPLPPARRVVRSWDEISQYLRARSADLRIAIDEVGRAEAQRRVQWAGVLGTLSAGGTYTHNFLTRTNTILTGVDASGNPTTATYTSPTPDSVGGDITATFPIIAPRAWNGIHAANVNIGVQRANLDDTKRLLSTTVANDALTVLTNERIADLNRVGLRNALERLELARRKTSLGAGTGLDVVRAQQDVENARATLVTGDENARQAREAFGLAIGVPEDVGVAGDLSVDAVTMQVLSQCKAAPSIEDRPDVVAARERVHLARVNTWDVKTQWSPTLGLQSTLATTSVNIPNSEPTTWNLLAVLNWNLWEGGARYGQLRDANLQVLEAQDRLDATRRTAVIQVVQAQRGVQVAQQSRDVAARSRDLAAEVDRLTRAGFMTGQGTSLDLVTAAAALRQAEINLALAEYTLVKAKILAVLALASCNI